MFCYVRLSLQVIGICFLKPWSIFHDSFSYDFRKPFTICRKAAISEVNCLILSGSVSFVLAALFFG